MAPAAPGPSSVRRRILDVSKYIDGITVKRDHAVVFDIPVNEHDKIIGHVQVVVENYGEISATASYNPVEREQQSEHA
jgi:hypothetical protein